jgi:rod shape determining protein RodA
MRREEAISGKLDWVAVLLYIIMVALGWLNIFASVYDEAANQTIWDLSLNSGRQLIFIAASFIIILAIIIIDMRFYETFAYLFYGIILIALLLVPFFGKEVGGNKAWIGIGSFGVQPSEFAKFITAIAVAKFIGSVGFRMDHIRNQAILFAMIGLPLVLILLQKDTGTAMVFTSFLLVFYREGFSPFLIIVGICAAFIFILTLLIPNQLYLHAGVAIVLILLIVFGRKKFSRIAVLAVGALLISGIIESVDYILTDVLKPHQQNRIKALINPDADPLGFGWNVTQSKIAIGSGGFSGKGFLEGTQTKFDFVPEQSTDFIFCTIGEEHGWIGSLVVISLFIFFLLRIIFLAERQRSRFARAYGYGVASIFFFHFAVNIGMTIGLFPVIGIPLPFFSYGGSSLWGFTILLFVLLKLDAHRSQVLQRI